MKIYIGTGREIGQRCIAWARENLPAGCELVDRPGACDVFISVLYPEILPASWVQSRPHYNFHPGMLPNYRGSGTCSWVIVNGEKVAGITLHVMDAGIDTGPIIDIRSFPVEPNDTAQSVFKKSEETIFEMFVKWFPILATHREFDAVPQDPNVGHTYYRKDLEKLKDLTKYVRALTFEGKESAYFINNAGEKIYLHL